MQFLSSTDTIDVFLLYGYQCDLANSDSQVTSGTVWVIMLPLVLHRTLDTSEMCSELLEDHSTIVGTLECLHAVP